MDNTKNTILKVSTNGEESYKVFSFDKLVRYLLFDGDNEAYNEVIKKLLKDGTPVFENYDIMVSWAIENEYLEKKIETIDQLNNKYGVYKIFGEQGEALDFHKNCGLHKKAVLGLLDKKGELITHLKLYNLEKFTEITNEDRGYLIYEDTLKGYCKYKKAVKFYYYSL